jgi:hypothetical protein
MSNTMTYSTKELIQMSKPSLGDSDGDLKIKHGKHLMEGTFNLPFKYLVNTSLSIWEINSVDYVYVVSSNGLDISYSLFQLDGSLVSEYAQSWEDGCTEMDVLLTPDSFIPPMVKFLYLKGLHLPE